MYWVIFADRYDDGVVLSAVPDTGPEDYEYIKGIPLLSRFPERSDAVMCYDPSYEEGIKLYDILPSMDPVLVVNAKVKDVLEAMELKDIEYLPIRLWDHRRTPASDDYYILNPIGGVDFIDMERSKYRMSALAESQIARVKNLVVDHNKISPDAKLFRATTKMDQMFIHDDVRIAFEQAGINGYKLLPAEGWDGFAI